MKNTPPIYGAVLSEWMAATDVGKPTAHGTRLRYSSTSGCAMQLGLTAAGIAPTNPIDLAGRHVANIGTGVHDQWQTALEWRYPDWKWEMEKSSIIPEADLSGSADGYGVAPDGHKVVLELKNMGGAAWRIASGLPGKGDKIKAGEGPRQSAVTQGAVNAYALDADEVVWPLLSMEAVSVMRAERMGLTERERFVSEWSMTRDEYTPVAETEIARHVAVLDLVDGAGVLPERLVPKWSPGSGVYDPNGQFIEDSSTTRYWGCAYCSHADVCRVLPQGNVEIEVETAVEIAGRVR